MSLRTRLAAVLAGVLVGPLLASWVIAAAVVPRVATRSAQNTADRGASAVQLALYDRCSQVGDSARLLAMVVGSQAGPLTDADG